MTPAHSLEPGPRSSDGDRSTSGPTSVRGLPHAFSRYRLISLLGSGNMGEVHRAYDTKLHRYVAVKLIRQLNSDPGAKEHLHKEARAMAALNHPNILAIYDLDDLDDGRPYIVTEYVKGVGLDRIERPLAWEVVREIGVALSCGLAAAHESGVLHRDIKPSNAIVDENGQVKLLDFGLAKLVDQSALVSAQGAASRRATALLAPKPAGALGTTLVSPRTTSHAEARRDGDPAGPLTGTGIGTPLYMPPEIWRGLQATARSDVYSLGALLYELCAGRPPHAGSPPHELGRAVVERDAPSLGDLVPSIDPGLATVIACCLEREPLRRYASGKELHDALQAVPEGNPYRGLAAFQAEQRTLFFGRGTASEELVRRMKSDSLVVVAGDRGVGKSSLCRAGALPAAQTGGLGGAWSVLGFVPGRSPLASLAAALAERVPIEAHELMRLLRADPGSLVQILEQRSSGEAGVVLFVDQLEELVTRSDPDEGMVVAEILGRLATGAPGVRVLMTLRSDYLARVAALPGLGPKLESAIYLLQPPAPPALREAVVRPLHRMRVSFQSDDLVETLVASAAGAPDGLPLLQFTLAELFRARDKASRSITRETVEKVGGIAEALGRHAEDVVQHMTAVQRSEARRILTMLASPRDAMAYLRAEDLVVGDPAAREALDGLVRGGLVVARLDPSQEPSYELSYPALPAAWSTLRRWLDEQAGSALLCRELEAAAIRWTRHGRTELWSKRQLDALRGAVEDDDLTKRARAFRDASREEVERRRRRRTRLVAALGLVALIACGALQLHAGRGVDPGVALRVDEGRRLIARAEREDDDAADCDYGVAALRVEAALQIDPGNAAVKELFGDALYARALLAERRHRRQERDELLARLALYDPDGARLRGFRAGATPVRGGSPAGEEPGDTTHPP